MYRASALLLLIILSSLITLAQPALAQYKKHPGVKPAITLDSTRSHFRPTFNLGSGSVGNYFYPQSLGSSWTMKIVQRLYDQSNRVLSSDSLFSKETVTSNSAKTFQGLPLISCKTSSWRINDLTHVDSAVSSYYVDDSLIMAVFNSSINNNQNRVLLVSPLKVGNQWRERVEDSARSEIATMHDTVNVPYGAFGNALVTVTRLGKIELDKYFVPNVGIVKTITRLPGRKPGETIVVMAELLELVRGVESDPGASMDPKSGLADPLVRR